jgi:hypothetical protein
MRHCLATLAARDRSPLGHLLDHDAIKGGIAAASAALDRIADAEQLHASYFLYDLLGNLARFIPLAGIGDDLFGHKAFDDLPEDLFRIGTQHCLFHG